MQIRRLISILVMFAILMQNVTATMLQSIILVQAVNASENSNDKNLEKSRFEESRFEEDECEVKKEKQCIDYSTKTIEGFPVTRCWKYEEISRCVGREKNYCQTFEDNRGCQEQHGKCLEQANVSKMCKNFEKKFKCGDKLEENAEVKHVDTEYLVKRDEKDLSNCTESDLKNCVIEHEQCLEPAETRNINGKDVHKECWKWDRKYYCKQNSFIDECKELKEKCKEKSRECIHKNEKGDCEHWDVNFECEEESREKIECIGGRFCIGGICDTHERFRPNNFGENIGTLIALANMKKQGMEGCKCPEGKAECNPEDIDPKDCKFFIGDEHKCQKFRGQWISYAIAAASIYMTWGAIPIGINPMQGIGAFGTKLGSMSAMEAAKFVGAQAAKIGLASMARVDCCAMDGMLTAFCGGKAANLKVKRQQRFCVKIGRYKKKWGLIVVTSYCCFKNKLTRIIQEQGRAQLGKSFGTAKNPDCSGLTVEEIQKIDFTKIEWGEVITEFKESAEEAMKENMKSGKFEEQARKLADEYKGKKFDKNAIKAKAEAYNVQSEINDEEESVKLLMERRLKGFYKGDNGGS